MKENNNKKGLDIEYSLINHINNNKFLNKLNPNIKLFIKELFPKLKNTDEIIAKKYFSNYKPDIVIEAYGIKKYISIKTGKNNSVHQEHIFSFCNFLKEQNTPEKTIANLLFFHFNDQTKNGSGMNRKNAANFIENNPRIIKDINNYFNNNNFVEKAINRILFEGEYYNLPKVDYIYYGNLNNGIWASRTQILNYMIKNNIFSNSIHISKIYYQSLQRNLSNKPQNEFRRYYVQFKWHSIENDLLNVKKE